MSSDPRLPARRPCYGRKSVTTPEKKGKYERQTRQSLPRILANEKEAQPHLKRRRDSESIDHDVSQNAKQQKLLAKPASPRKKLQGVSTKSVGDHAPGIKSTSSHQQWIVSAIVGEEKRDGEIWYLIRWKDCLSIDDSWVKASDCNCYEEINKFKKRKAENPSSSGWIPDPIELQNREKEKTKKSVVSGKSADKPARPSNFLWKWRKRASVRPNYEKLSVVDQLSRIPDAHYSFVPTRIMDRLKSSWLPDSVLSSINPPMAAADVGIRRYLVEWSDGESAWLPGMVCTKLFPKLVIQYSMQIVSFEDEVEETPFCDLEKPGSDGDDRLKLLD